MVSTRYIISIYCVLGLLSLAFGNEPDVEIKIGEVFLTRHLLAQVNISIEFLYVNPQNGDIVFIEMIEDNPDGSDVYQVNVLKSGTDKSYQIEGYKGHPRAITEDLDNDILYIGTSRGIYKLSKNSHKVELFEEEGHDVKYVFFANKELYFNIYPEHELHKYVWVNGVPKRETVNFKFTDERISIDNEGTIYYVDSEQILKKRYRGQTKSVTITIPENNDNVIATAIDVKERLVFSAGNKIYTLKKDENVATLKVIVNHEIEAIGTHQDESLFTVEGLKICKYLKSIKLSVNKFVN